MPKQKRVSYENTFKLSVVDYAEKSGNSVAGRKFGVSEKCVRAWRENKSKLIEAPKGQRRAVTNRVRPYHELENELSVWLLDLHRSGKVVSKNAIRIKARQLGTFVKHRKGFKGSDSWYRRFMKSRGIHLGHGTHNVLAKFQGKVNEEMKTDFDSKILETNMDKETDDFAREERNGVKEDAEEFQKGKSVKSVNSVSGNDDNVEYSIYIEDKGMDVTENTSTIDADEGTETAECDDCDEVETFWEDVKGHKNTEDDVITTKGLPENFDVSETSGEHNHDDIKPVLNELGVIDPGNVDGEVEKTLIDSGHAAEKMEISENNTSQEHVATIETESLNNSGVKEKSSKSKNLISGKDDAPEVVKNSKTAAKVKKHVGREGTGNMDGVYHYITMLVSSEQDDAVRLLFRDKNWRCWFKELSDGNIADLIEGGFGRILPSPEREEGLETNVFTEIKSQVRNLDDTNDDHSGNQSLTDDRNTARNKNISATPHDQIDDMTEPSFVTVKTERNVIHEFEDIDSPINGQNTEGMFSTLKGHIGEDTGNSVIGRFKEDSDSSIDMKSVINKKSGKKRKSKGENKGSKSKKSNGDDKLSTKRKSNDNTKGGIDSETKKETAELLKGMSEEGTEDSINVKTEEKMLSTVVPQFKNDESIENSNDGFKCTLCATNCMTNLMLKEHFAQHHHGEWLDFYCKDCFERFKTRKELCKHRANAQHAKTTDFTFKSLTTTEDLVAMGHIKCEICGRFYTRKDSLRRHLFDTHGEVTKFPCLVCGYEFEKFDELQRHKREAQHITAISQLQYYQCEACGKILKRYDSFREHKITCLADGRSIEDIVKFPCDICGMQFLTKIRLNTHKRITHCKTLSVCDICGHTCKNNNILRVHKQRHDPKNRKYSCDQCRKSFFTKAVLTEHKRTHTKEKPFNCEMCSYRCAIKQNLYKHERKVHKTKSDEIIPVSVTE